MRCGRIYKLLIRWQGMWNNEVRSRTSRSQETAWNILCEDM